MSEQKNSNGGGNGCVLGALIVVVVLFALVLGAIGGVAAEREGFARTTTIYPAIPAPQPEVLNYQPSVQTFADNGECGNPTAPVAGWEKGIGGALPPCWDRWTREQQNQFLRSH